MKPPPKPEQTDLGALADLPSFRFTSTPATTREQTVQEDVAYGVKSLDDLAVEVSKRLKIPSKKASAPVRK